MVTFTGVQPSSVVVARAAPAAAAQRAPSARTACLARARRAVKEYQIHGIATTLPFFERMLAGQDELEELFRFLGVAADAVPFDTRESANASRRRVESEPSPELLEYLVRNFEESNRKLARDFGLDLSCWMSR